MKERILTTALYSLMVAAFIVVPLSVRQSAKPLPELKMNKLPNGWLEFDRAGHSRAVVKQAAVNVMVYQPTDSPAGGPCVQFHVGASTHRLDCVDEAQADRIIDFVIGD